MSELINILQSTGPTCYFISPHLDDAAFSAGFLMKNLAPTNKVVLVNIFTKGGKPPYTFSARRFLAQCGYSDPEKLTQARKEEDEEFVKGLNISAINFDFVNAIYRRKNDFEKGVLSKLLPELIHTYPIYQLNVIRGKISKEDDILIADLSAKLKERITDENYVIFCPLGVGGHVDHRIVRQVCESQFKNIIYWQDYPYNTFNPGSISKLTDQLTEYKVRVDAKIKENLIEVYKSQIKAIFKSEKNINVVDEVFYAGK